MGEESGGGVKVDLTHAVNRIVDSWYQLFESDVQIDMPTPACAYPADWDEQTIDDVKNRARPEWFSLRWNQAQHPTDSIWWTREHLVKLEWNLHVVWQGLTYETDDDTYHVIENARASCELVKPAGLKLYVNALFGHPNFYGQVATLPMWFRVRVLDGDTPIRDQQKGFLLSADGSRSHLD
jgi:hypothetical protein